MARLKEGSIMDCPKCKDGVLTNCIEINSGELLHIDLFMGLQGRQYKTGDDIKCFKCGVIFTIAYVCNPKNWLAACDYDHGKKRVDA